MLGKLLKYEIKATARIFVPLYLALIAFTLITKLLNLMNPSHQTTSFHSIASVLSLLVYFTLIVGIMVMTLVIMIQRFYKSLLGNEGYLMFTLPVQAWMHILSKLISAMLWTVSSSLAAVCSILIIAFDKNIIREIRLEYLMVIQTIEDYLGSNIYLMAIEFIIIVLAATASGILMVYGAITLGHQFSKHKLLASFGMYIVLRIIVRTIPLIGFAILGHSFMVDFTGNVIPTTPEIQQLLLFCFIYASIISTGCFFLTQYLLKNRLNLE